MTARCAGWATALAACAAALLLAACASKPPAKPGGVAGKLASPVAASAARGGTTEAAQAVQAAPARFTFSAGDEFDLRVPDAPQFDQTLKVRPDGKVSMALVGTVFVLGRTPEDVQAELRERLTQLAGAPGQREYLLQPNDEIDIKFPFQPQLNETVKLRPDGKVQLQLVGPVRAEGLSPEELRGELRSRYARWLRNPDLAVIVRTFATQNVRVNGGGANGSSGRAGLSDLKPTVIVRNYQAPQVFVGGEVTKPGVLVYRPGLSLLQAIVEAGGHLPSGDAARLIVLRRGADDNVQVIRPGFTAELMRSPDRDVALLPFDVVLLPKSDTATLADNLNQYVFNIVPFLRNSSFGFAYNIRGNNN